MQNRTTGFTLIEILVTIAIIVIIIAILFSNYNTFTSRSLLRVRIGEVVSLVLLVQDRSAAGITKSSSSLGQQPRYQLVRITTRGGNLKSIGAEESVSLNFTMADDTDKLTGTNVETDFSEKFSIKVCQIDKDKNFVNASTIDDFDIIVSVERPTRETYTNIVDINGDEIAGLKTAGGVGTRIVFELSDESLKRSIDIYHTGLVEIAGKNFDKGCDVPKTPPST